MKISQPKKSHKKLIIAIVSVLLLAGIGTATFFILNKDNSSSNKETNTEVATNTDVASNTDVALNDTTETTETVTTETVEEEPSEEPSVETPSENTTTETEKPSTTPSENKPSNTTTETPNTTETPSTPSTTETSSVPTTTETPTTEEPTPNVEKCMCGTPMQMMSGYILHRAEGYYALVIRFSNGEKMPYEDRGDGGAWISDYMRANGITSYSIAEDFIVTTPEWREENVTRMCCPSCRATSEGFIAY